MEAAIFMAEYNLSGWGQVHQSSAWTLTYRELKALESVSPTITEGPKPAALQ